MKLTWVTYNRNVYKSRDAKLKFSPPPLLIGKKSLLFGKEGLAFVGLNARLNALAAYQTELHLLVLVHFFDYPFF